MKRRKLTDLLPEFPATRHLPWKPNTKGDRVATEAEAAVIFGTDRTTIQEKIDGANCGMALVDDHPVIRSRSKILRKGDLSKNLNPSLSQFAAAFNWFYSNREKFENLANFFGPVTVYGEWMVQQHGMEYDELPDWFIAYDVYDQEAGRYVESIQAYNWLRQAGFLTVPTYFNVVLKDYETLERMANEKSSFSSNLQREGVYVKVNDDKWVTDRFKMVRQGFQQGCLLGSEIRKNKLR